MIRPKKSQSTDRNGTRVSNIMDSNHLRSINSVVYGESSPQYMNLTRLPGAGEELVSLIDTSRLIHNLRKRLSTSNAKGRILMKLDVEGLEYDIVPHLVRTQAICALHTAFLEWHPATLAWQEHREGLEAVRRMISAERHVVDGLSGNLPSCAVKLTDLDDETFARDGRPWPEDSLCPEGFEN